MTETELAAIEARANAATKGPWGLLPDGVSRKPPNNCPIVFRADTDLRYIAFCRDANEWNQGGPTDNLANATFIAHARTDIPALVAEVRRLREVVAKLPTTADGVPVVPGMTVYFADGGSRRVDQIRESDWKTGIHGRPAAFIDPWWCIERTVYSTREAALAASKGEVQK